MSASCGDGHNWFLANLHDCEQNVLVDVGARGTLRAYSASRCRKPRRQTFSLGQDGGEECATISASALRGSAPSTITLPSCSSQTTDTSERLFDPRTGGCDTGTLQAGMEEERQLLSNESVRNE